MIFCCYPKDNIKEPKDESIVESMLSVMNSPGGIAIIYDIVRDVFDGAEEL